MSAGYIHFPDLEIFDSQTFVVDGTFNVPSRVDKVFVLAVGGGSGGSGDNGGGASHGGHGAVPQFVPLDVTPGGTVSVTVGLGGAGGAGGSGSPVNIGAAGGDTIVGPYTFPGAPQSDGTLTSEYQGWRPNGGFTLGGTEFTGARQKGADTLYATGGASGPLFNGGGGGGAGLDDGGNGGDNNGGNLPTAGGVGAGGGGAETGTNTAGANGGRGEVTFYWVRQEI